MENTLMIGNGFVRTIYTGAPDWKSLYSMEQSEIKCNNYTILYELYLLRTQQSDNQYKRKLVDKLREYVQSNKINSQIRGVDKFGDYLNVNGINNVITTNLDKGIENILCDRNGYYEEWPDIRTKEKIYSIRRNMCFTKNGHTIRIWKIHGDIDNIESVALGFDQYCGSIAKIKDYINGQYISSSGVVNNVPIHDRCSDEFELISWIDLFFITNIFIVGFGLDFAEIDIWWLLNKRYRLIKQGVNINNRIVFLYTDYDTGNASELLGIKSDDLKQQMFSEKIMALESFGVECKKNGSEHTINKINV